MHSACNIVYATVNINIKVFKVNQAINCTFYLIFVCVNNMLNFGRASKNTI